MAFLSSQQAISDLLNDLNEALNGAVPIEPKDPEPKRSKRKNENHREPQPKEASLKSAVFQIEVSPEAALQTASPRRVAPRAALSKTGASKTAWMMNGVDGTLRVISTTSLEPATATVSSEEGFEVLCSYNWLMTGDAILVPGAPPKWSPPPLPCHLDADSGSQSTDQTAFQVPQYPFEPAFQAIAAMNPYVPLDAVDIIVNRNSLRKLLDFAAGKSQDAFCMALNMVHNTVFITRKERHAHQIIFSRANSGYGHAFEEAFTTPQEGLDSSSSHHRVIRYRLGHLDCVVRFEVDAYYDELDEESCNAHVLSPDDGMTDGLAQLALNEQALKDEKQGRTTVKKPSGPAHKTTQTATTHVIPKGHFVASTKLAEIKIRKSGRVNEAMPQLWFGRTPYLLIGKATDGVVQSISCTDIKARFAEWEKVNQEKLQKLVSLLEELKQVMRDTGGKPALLVCAGKGAPLQVCRAKNTMGVLPKDVILRHWDTRGEGN